MKRACRALALGLLLVSTGAALAASTQSPLALSAEGTFLAQLNRGPEKVGEDVDFAFVSPSSEIAFRTSAPMLAWQREIQDAGASYIAVHFSHFDLPEGATLVLRSPDASRVLYYTGAGKADLGPTEGFWGTYIPGDTAVLELYTTVGISTGAVTIDRYAKGFPAPERGIVTRAICGSDDSDWAQCYTGSEPDIYDHSRAVARLLINGSSACTGWLVGDAGHLLTNNHCVGNSSSAANTDYEFMAEGSCATNCSSWFACPGTVISGASFVQTDSALDYTLVQLPVNASLTYGYLQMRSAGAGVGERIYIPGHPAAWGKKIAVTSGDPSDSSGFCQVQSLNAPPCSGGSGDTGYYCDTQGGSSGSPVIAYSDHAVVSLHHCANCPNRGVPIEDVISDLGSNVPPNSLAGGTPPPPPPPPVCFAKGQSCSVDGDCCSNKCRGPNGAKSCK